MPARPAVRCDVSSMQWIQMVSLMPPQLDKISQSSYFLVCVFVLLLRSYDNLFSSQYISDIGHDVRCRFSSSYNRLAELGF